MSLGVFLFLTFDAVIFGLLDHDVDVDVDDDDDDGYTLKYLQYTPV